MWIKIKPVILQSVDEASERDDDHGRADDAIEGDLAGQWQDENESRQDEEDDGKVRSGEPAVARRRVAQLLCQTDRPSHEWNRVEN